VILSQAAGTLGGMSLMAIHKALLPFEPSDEILVVTVPNTVAAPGTVRSAIVPLKPYVGPIIANLVLLTSEVVANTVTWSTGSSRDPITIRIAYGLDRVRVDVTDRNDGLDAPSKPAGLLELSRWRESLVARFSNAWGVRWIDAGSVIWFELDGRHR
jgi:hypothetical protein